MRLNIFEIVVLILVVIGGLNWGLVGLYNFDLVAALFGVMSPVARAVYIIVGLAALYTCYIIYKGSKTITI